MTTVARHPTDPRRNRELAAIHAGVAAKGIDPDTYQVILERAGAPVRPQPDGTVRRSAADLSPAGRAAVIGILAGRPGARPAAGGDDPGAPWRPAPRPPHVSDRQWKYLGDLAVQLHLDEQSWTRLVRHITGLDDWHWLDVPRARTLIAGLLRIQASRPGRRVPARGNPRRR